MGASHPCVWALRARGMRRCAPRGLDASRPLVGRVRPVGWVLRTRVYGHFVPVGCGAARRACVDTSWPRVLTTRDPHSGATHGIADANLRSQSEQPTPRAAGQQTSTQRSNPRHRRCQLALAQRATYVPRSGATHTSAAGKPTFRAAGQQRRLYGGSVFKPMKRSNGHETTNHRDFR